MEDVRDNETDDRTDGKRDTRGRVDRVEQEEQANVEADDQKGSKEMTVYVHR